MTQHKSRYQRNNAARLAVVALIGVVVVIAALLHGLDVQLFNPKGLIAGEQHRLMLLSIGIMLVLAIPALTLLYFFTWKYRDTNSTATYDAHTHRGKGIVFGMWIIPIIFFLVLASIMWPATHRLAPQKSIAAGSEPLTIQVVALRWKWLFIYPQQDIATLNFVQLPTNTPVQFELTADEAPMNSFWIPHLGGQLYAMTGHDNRLNLMADTPGDYEGSAAEINGAGFAGMRFIARASSEQSFDQWVASVKHSPNVLNNDEYQKLLTPSENNSPATYADAEAGLYHTILDKYAGSHHHEVSE